MTKKTKKKRNHNSIQLERSSLLFAVPVRAASRESSFHMKHIHIINVKKKQTIDNGEKEHTLTPAHINGVANEMASIHFKIHRKQRLSHPHAMIQMTINLKFNYLKDEMKNNKN